MSDARPITLVTEFVCGSCWNSFNRQDEGVVETETHVRCPHCGHDNALSDGPGRVTGKVQAVPPRSEAELMAENSQTFGSEGEGKRLVQPPRRSEAPRVSAPGAVQAPSAVSAPTSRRSSRRITAARVAAPAAAPSPAPSSATARTTRAGLAGAEMDTAPEMAIAASESTDPGAAPRVVRSTGGDSGAYASADRRDTEPTPSAPAPPSEQPAQPPGAEGLDAPGPDETARALRAAEAYAHEQGGGERIDLASTIPDPTPEGDPFAAVLAEDDGTFEGPAPEPEPVDPDVPDDGGIREWKLKAPSGLTYNFHSLDAMIGWAATKSGSDMQISADGEHWFGFGVFLEHIRVGRSAVEALALVQGGSAAGELRFVGSESGAMQVRSAMDDIAAVDALEAAEQRLRLGSIDYEGSGAVAVAGRADSPLPDTVTGEHAASARPSPRAPRPAVANGRAEREPGAGRKAGGAARPVHPSTRSATVGKAAAESTGRGTRLMVFAAVTIAVVVIGAIVLHFSGVVKIPGLP